MQGSWGVVFADIPQTSSYETSDINMISVWHTSDQALMFWFGRVDTQNETLKVGHMHVNSFVLWHNDSCC